MAAEKTERVTIRMTPQERAALEWLAAEAGTTAAGVVRAWVAPWVGRARRGADEAGSGAPAAEATAVPDAGAAHGEAAVDEAGVVWEVVPAEWPDVAK